MRDNRGNVNSPCWNPHIAFMYSLSLHYRHNSKIHKFTSLLMVDGFKNPNQPVLWFDQIRQRIDNSRKTQLYVTMKRPCFSARQSLRVETGDTRFAV